MYSSKAFTSEFEQKNALRKCRTCLTPVVDTKMFHSLTDRPQIGELTLAEILFEVAKLAPTDALPQFICSNCRTCLVNAVDFVRKAHRANDSLLASLDTVTQDVDSKAIDCLVEMPIEWPENEHNASSMPAITEIINIKEEIKENYVDCGDDNNDNDNDNEDTFFDNESNEFSSKEKSIDEEIESDKKVKYEDYITRNTNGQYVCKVCQKTYTWVQALYRHAANHFPNARFECTLCQRTFRRRDKWRKHLRTKGHRQRRLESKPKPNEQSTSTTANSTLTRSKRNEVHHTLREDDDGVDDDDDDLSETGDRAVQPTKATRRGRPRNSNEIVVKDANGRFVCSVCQQTFAWLKTLQRHAKMHTSQPKYDCKDCGRSFLRKDKYTDHLRTHNHYNLKRQNLLNEDNGNYRIIFLEQLYGAGTRPWCSRSCRLCNIENFETNAQLRLHLAQHQHDFTTIDDLNFDSPLVQEHFWQLKTIDQIKTSIRTELQSSKECIPAKYYAIVNGLGYEMDINDSDEENDDKTSSSRYKCELCLMNFHRKHELLTHTNTHTADDKKWPYRCDICKTEFVCRQMYESHQRHYCRNRCRKYHCEGCPGRFAWQINLQQHDHSRLNASDMKSSAQPIVSRMNISKGIKLDIALCQPHGLKMIKCMICLSQHATIADLRVHLQGHCKGVTLLERQQQGSQISVGDLSQLFYPEETPMKTNQLKERIMSDVSGGATEVLERFYSITNEVGNELHLDSSETEYSDTPEATENDPLSAGPIKKLNRYRCEVCNSNDNTFRRKHELLHHQKATHTPEMARNVCVFCGARFVCAMLLEHHYARLCRNPRRRHICRKCPQRFMWRENLKVHIGIAHPTVAEIVSSYVEQQSFPCPECNRSFSMRKDLTRHLLSSHHSTASLQCLWCPRRFYRQANYQLHLQRHSIPADQVQAAQNHVRSTSGPNGLKFIRCKVCNEDQRSIAELRRHLSLHVTASGSIESLQNYSILNQFGVELNLNDSETENEDNNKNNENEMDQKNNTMITTVPSYTCVLCSLRFQRKFQILRHQRSMHKHEELPFRCSDQCYFRTVCEDLLIHHQRNQCANQDKQQICNQCGLKFYWAENLQKHQQLIHAEDSTSSIHNTEEDGTNNGNEANLLSDAIKKEPRNINNVKTKTKKPPKPPKTTKEEKRTFLCSLCGYALTSSSNLLVHMRRHNGEKPYKCDFCDKGFARSSDMITHRRTHTGERPHKCTLCEKAFARSSKLLMHMRTHSGERPYKCTYCEKSFSQSNDLRLHTRRHTGERPYGCDVCGERFIQNTHLKQHRLLKGHVAEEIPT